MQALPPISCVKSFKLACVNYTKLSGRTRRSEFFYFYFIINAILAIFYLIYYIQLVNDNYDQDTGKYEHEGDYIVYLYIFLFIIIANFLPIVSIQIRRLHDIGRTGWFILLYLVPLIGYIILLVLFCIDSEQTENEYGPSPKYIILSGNLMPGNNYNPPVVLNPQPESLVEVSVNDNQLVQPTPSLQPNSVPYQQSPYTSQNTPYSQVTPNQ